jgi:hypothetical protein
LITANNPSPADGAMLSSLNGGATMRLSFTPRVLLIFAITLSLSGMWLTAGAAQEEASDAAVVHNGNTDIVFEKASVKDLPVEGYQAFDQFVSAHPEIGKDLARNPRLINNESFADDHPALADFLHAHPQVASNFADNPGNYVNMPLAVEASLKRHPIEQQ